MKIKIWSMIAVTLLVRCALAISVSTGKPAVGEWNSHFADTLKVAVSKHIPVILFWGNIGCGYCSKMKLAGEDKAFREWQAEKAVYMVSSNGREDADAIECYNFVKNPDKAFPYMGVYWVKPDGSEIKVLFTGREGYMPVKSGSLGEQFMRSVDQVLVDWDPSGSSSYAGPDFLVPDTAGSRLEYVIGTTQNVVVQLVRTNNTTTAYSSNLTIGSESHLVQWAAGESSKSVSVSTDGKTTDIPLTILDSKGTLHSRIVIHAASDPANSVRSPKSFGEAFDWGEWTLDYAAARAKVAADPDARLLVMFSGVLWCPYCAGIESSLLADPRFPAWARENKVALVLFDQGRATSPATAYGQTAPRLVTVLGDPNKSGEAAVSGASYVSRKGITDAQAKAYMDSVAAYTEKWLAPGSTAARLGNPTILLINPTDETVAARFSALRDADKVYDPAENIARLNELIGLAGETEADGYVETTALEHALGTSSEMTLQINDKIRVFKVNGLSGVGRLRASVSDGSATVSICRHGEGAPIATGAGVAAATFLTPDDLSVPVYVKVAAYSDAGSIAYALSGPTAKTLTLTSSLEPIPGEIAFEQSNFELHRLDGSAEISLVRRNGSSGACSVKISRVGGSSKVAERYVWDADPVFSWADGESGTKSFVLRMREDVIRTVDETLVLGLSVADGDVDLSGSQLTVTFRDSTKPSFAQREYDIELYAGFKASLEEAQPLYNAEGRVSLKKVSGSLPNGVKLVFDTSSRTIDLNKSASRVGTYRAEFCVKSNREEGDPSIFNVVVKDPAMVNPFLGRQFAAKLPLFSGRLLVGMVDLKMTKNNKLTAKYSCDRSNKAFSFSGLWGGLDEDGTAYTALSLKRGEQVLLLELGVDGSISASVEDPAYGDEVLSSGSFSIPDEYSSFAGTYTAALASREGVGGFSISINMSSSAASSKGQATCRISYPNGKSTSAKVTLLPINDEFALLPIFINSRTDKLSAPLLIRKNAASAPSPRAVVALAEADIVWTHVEKGRSETHKFDVFGSYFSITDSLLTCCGYNALTFIAPEGVEMLGSGMSIDIVGNKLVFPERVSGLSVSYASKTGIVSGKTKVVTSVGKSVSAKFTGVVLPGWYDCGCGETDDDTLVPLQSGVPFVLGSMSYTDIVAGQRVTVLVPIRFEIIN